MRPIPAMRRDSGKRPIRTLQDKTGHDRAHAMRPYGSNIYSQDKLMPYNPDIHKRRSIRLKSYDYSQPGAYFVTICAWQRECLFGQIVNDAMVLNDTGRIVADEWAMTSEMRSNIELDVYSLMPNHFHAIILIHDTTVDVDTVGAHCMRPDTGIHVELINGEKQWVGGAGAFNAGACNAPLRRRQSGSLGAVVSGFKSATTRRINIFRNNKGCPVWQRNFYERVIRNESEMSRAREYIVNNPLKWALDKENPVNDSHLHP